MCHIGQFSDHFSFFHETPKCSNISEFNLFADDTFLNLEINLWVVKDKPVVLC